MNPRKSASVLLVVAMTAFSVSSGAPASAERSLGPSPSTSRVPLSLTIDPNFTRDRLPANVRHWYDLLWLAIENPNPGHTFLNPIEQITRHSAVEMAASNNTYIYGRSFSNYVMALLHVFRITGEQALLDKVDALAQIMRGELRDWSMVTLGGKTFEADGFLNWRWDEHNSPLLIGTDLNQMDEMLTHALVAEFAHAFHANRGFAQKYAEHADFWKGYLRDHFEAKWRKRHRKPTGKFMEKTLTHAYLAWIRYHYYMHALTGEEWYRVEAERRAKVIAAQMIEVKDKAAFIWDHRTTGESREKTMMAQPFTYVRYTTLMATDLAYENFSVFTPLFMQKMTSGVTEFLMDNGSIDFAPDISGGVTREGLPSKYTARESRSKFALSNFTGLGAWDPSGKIVSVSEQVYREIESNPAVPNRVHIPSGMVQALMLKNGALR